MWSHLASGTQQQAWAIHWLASATPVFYRVRHPAVGAIINMGYQVRREVCMAIAEEVATLLNAGCGTKKKGGGWMVQA